MKKPDKKITKAGSVAVFPTFHGLNTAWLSDKGEILPNHCELAACLFHI